MQSFTYPICTLKATELYLHREQSYPGRCILVLKRHAEEYSELTSAERLELQDDLYQTTKAIEQIYHPGKINLGVFGDTVRHFHIHVVPKYWNKLDWNSTFQMNPDKIYPTEEELKHIADKFLETIKMG